MDFAAPLPHAAHGPQAAVQTMRFVLGHHPPTWILCAEGDRGLCAVLLGDSPEALTDDLARRFPKARRVHEPGCLPGALAHIVGLLRGEAPSAAPNVPLQLCGTPFEQQVYRALMAIPSGCTTTYGAIAASIGRPKAARAVGAACSKNPLALVVPCHRVLHGGGPKMGYRWGVALKKQLLDVERRAAMAEQGA